MIYPEGATTNGEALVYFNKGAFASLRPVQPIVLKYWTLGKIKASQDVLGISNHLNVIGLALAITLRVIELPVFAPNEYFWKHHWQEGKEEKWEAFARVVREIMAEVGDFQISDLTMQDKFDYIEKLKGRNKPKSKAE